MFIIKWKNFDITGSSKISLTYYWIDKGKKIHKKLNIFSKFLLNSFELTLRNHI